MPGIFVTGAGEDTLALSCPWLASSTSSQRGDGTNEEGIAFIARVFTGVPSRDNTVRGTSRGDGDEET